MKIEIDIEPYDPARGLVHSFERGGMLKVQHHTERGFVLAGDKVGFAALAEALLTMVHSGVPENSTAHMHIDDSF